MKSKNLSIVMCLMMVGMFIAGCSDDKETSSFSKVGDVSNSSCLRESRAEGVWGNPILTLKRVGNNLYCQLTDYVVNCAHGEIQVGCKEDGQTLNINLDEGLGEIMANCLCPINVSFTIFDALQDQYQLMLNGRALGYISFKDHQVMSIDLNTLAVAYEEGFQYPLRLNSFSVLGAGSAPTGEDAGLLVELHNHREVKQMECLIRNYHLPEAYSFLDATIEEDEQGCMVINILTDGIMREDGDSRATLYLVIVNCEDKPAYRLRVLQTTGKKDAEGHFVGERTETLYEGSINVDD